MNQETKADEADETVQEGLLAPGFKPGYSLLFGSSHFYMVFKMIATIYERLVKAKKLISEKVQLDCDKDPEVKQLLEKLSADSIAEK